MPSIYMTLCAEQAELTARLNDARKKYVAAKRRLEGLAPQDFGREWREVEFARMDFEAARTSLDKHIAEHACAELPISERSN